MTHSKHIIPPELKEQILERIKQGGISISQVAQEHGISPKTIYKWLDKGVSPPSLMDCVRLKRENQALKEIIGQLTFETALSKKKRILVGRMQKQGITKTELARSLDISRSSLYYKPRLPEKTGG